MFHFGNGSLRLLDDAVFPSGTTNLSFMNFDTWKCLVSNAFRRVCTMSDNAVTPVVKFSRPGGTSEILKRSMNYTLS